MANTYFRTVDVQSPEQLLIAFEKKVREKIKEYNSWSVYLASFELNRAYYEEIIKQTDLSFLKEISKELFENTKKKYGSENTFVKERDFEYGEKGSFKAEFHLFNKDIFGLAEHYPNYWRSKQKSKRTSSKQNRNRDMDVRNAYFRTFVHVSIFFCARYRYKLVYDKDPKKVLKKVADNELPKTEEKSYYIFYNRSQYSSDKLGTGKIVLRNNQSADLTYYYDPKTTNNSNSEEAYSKVQLKGTITNYETKGILVIAFDDNSNLRGKDKRGIKSTHEIGRFTLKKSKGDNPNILLGINCSVNRDKYFPFATYLILIETNMYKSYYGEKHSFDTIKKTRSTKDIPPEIVYYLSQKILTQEFVLDNLMIKATQEIKPLQKPFEIPFYSKDRENLALLAGKYRGISIVNNGQTDILIISKLVISDNGTIQLVINNTGDDTREQQKITGGVIKKIDSSSGSNIVKLFINLRYDETTQSHRLTHYLEYSRSSIPNRDDVIKTDFFLKGSFAGISVITEKPSASAVFFKKVDANEDVQVGQIEINEYDSRLTELLFQQKSKYESLFNCFLSECSQYCNSSGVQKISRLLNRDIKRVNAMTDSENLDIFISIPLTHNDNPLEYDTNSSIAGEIISQLTEVFKIEKVKIFCACFRDGIRLTYDEFIDKRKKMTYHEFESALSNIDKSKSIIFIYPNSDESGGQKLSSSIFEISYAIGQKKQAIILCDSGGINNLPTILTVMYPNRIIPFEFKDIFSIKNLFIDNRGKIKELLAI